MVIWRAARTSSWSDVLWFILRNSDILCDLPDLIKQVVLVSRGHWWFILSRFLIWFFRINKWKHRLELHMSRKIEFHLGNKSTFLYRNFHAVLFYNFYLIILQKEIKIKTNNDKIIRLFDSDFWFLYFEKLNFSAHFSWNFADRLPVHVDREPKSGPEPFILWTEICRKVCQWECGRVLASILWPDVIIFTESAEYATSINQMLIH